MTDKLSIAPLPVPRTASPKTWFGRWLEGGIRPHDAGQHESTHPWHKVLWLTGVDYFSTLGYQPGIALLAAGALSPFATLILLAVTLCCALPVYAQVAKRSYAGQGSIAMLENLFHGWKSKLFVLILLGFAATDFVITMTLSAADAAKHAVENPYLHPYLGDATLLITMGLLALLAAVFLKGFREAINLAMWIAVPYLLLNSIVILRGFWEVLMHPELFGQWRLNIGMHGDWTGVWIISALVFPKLALGLSGFETGVAVMPVISGDPGEETGNAPIGRIRATKKLLASAAVIMSVMLLASSFVTTLLIPEQEYSLHGKAAGRAIAYLAHGLLGHAFGSIYDLSTIVILWFAGASAMAGLLNLIPRYLPRFGMAPRWILYSRPLVLVLFATTLLITLIFRANVEAQAGAYATGVLVLMLSAAIAVAFACWRESFEAPVYLSKARLISMSLAFWVVTAVFGFTLADNVFTRPDGVIIGSVFIFAILTFAALSRYQRSRELRVTELALADDESADLWPSLRGKTINLVPLRSSTPEARARKASELRKYYNVAGPIAFLHVTLNDNRSEFLASLKVQVQRDKDDFVIQVSGAVAVANTIAYISELLDPKTLFLGLTRQNLMTQAFRYLLWGEGETGLMVYTILLRYWEWTPEDDVRPLIFMMSE